MRLADALRLRPPLAVALVGAGGKSGAMRRLVLELASEIPLIVTTTTKLGFQQSDLAPAHMIVERDVELEDLGARLGEHGAVLVTGPLEAGGRKWLGLAGGQLARLRSTALQSGAVLLIEADGARQRSLKAPAAHEPAVPDFVDLVVPMAGIDAVGAHLSDAIVHRPELLVSLLGLASPGVELSAQHIAEALCSPNGGLKNVPAGSEARLLINKVEDAERLEIGGAIASRALETDGVRAVVLAAVAEEDPVREVHGRVAGVVLAAGASTRLQRPKQLVRWRGKSLVWHALQAARSGGLHPIVVVLGAGGENMRRQLEGLEGEDVIFVDNPRWKQGQSSSVNAGLSAAADQAEAAIFLLADMPLVGADLVRGLVGHHRRTLAPIIAPRHEKRSANPVLFDRQVFPSLLALHGDTGGRALFDRFPVEHLEWPHDVFLDVDTEEDLRRLEALE